MDPPIYDVLIIGAGPCGLAVASRLCERCPSALFTDDEHQRYHWIRRHAGRMAIKNRKSGAVKSVKPDRSTDDERYATLVLDASGDEWLAKWNRLFCLFDISHLRSPMFFHVDPRDRDSLLGFAFVNGRQGECREIGGCVGKEKSKHHKKQERRKPGWREPAVNERDRRDYFTPSRELFSDQCQGITNHYSLGHGLIKHESVEDIDFKESSDSASRSLFTVQTNKATHRARVLVLAVGPANAPCIPGMLPTEKIEGACHSMQIQDFPDPAVASKQRRNKPTHVVVVGGGLTAAQVADLAVRRGVSKVWLIMRSHLKVKPFDLDLEWLGKFRNTPQAAFWTEDSDAERLRQIVRAKGGGSVTPQFQKVLKARVGAGRLEVVTNTVIRSRVWSKEGKQWTVRTEPPIDLPPIDYIYYATGVQTDIATLPYLQTMQRKFPIKTQGGLPCITDDLMWSKGVPLFITGRLGALQIGPGAANLAGARSGAERIAWSIAEYLDDKIADEDEAELYTIGAGSRYAALEEGSGAEVGRF